MTGSSDCVVCVDVGSTFTKAALVELGSGRLLGTASHRTTIDTDVMDGYDACRALLGAGPAVPALACSSAGGGLRLAVVGYERVVTAEAGRRVGLSAGGRVVHVIAGPMSGDDLDALVAARPDVVLLVGGTDGGNSETLLHNAVALAGRPITVYGDGKQTRCFGYVGDVVGALIKLMDHDEAVGQVFNIGSNEEVTILELAQRIKKLTRSESEIVFVPYDEAYEEGFEDMPRRVPDIAKVHELVGFRPEMTLDGILHSVMEYQSGRASASRS